MEEVKLNFRGKCENLDCEVCKEVEESQKHILECREITKMKKDIERPPEYENIFGKNVKMQMKVAQHFLEHLKIKSEIEKKT